MAIVGVAVAYFAYSTVQRLARRRTLGHLRRRICRGLAIHLHRFAGCGAATGALRHVAGQHRRPGHGRHPRPDRHRRGADHGRARWRSSAAAARICCGQGRTANCRRRAVWIGGLLHRAGAGGAIAAGLGAPGWLGVGRRAEGLPGRGAGAALTRSSRIMSSRACRTRRWRPSSPGILGALIVLGVALAVACASCRRNHGDTADAIGSAAMHITFSIPTGRGPASIHRLDAGQAGAGAGLHPGDRADSRRRVAGLHPAASRSCSRSRSCRSWASATCSSARCWRCRSCWRRCPSCSLSTGTPLLTFRSARGR